MLHTTALPLRLRPRPVRGLLLSAQMPGELGSVVGCCRCGTRWYDTGGRRTVVDGATTVLRRCWRTIDRFTDSADFAVAVPGRSCHLPEEVHDIAVSACYVGRVSPLLLCSLSNQQNVY